MYFEKDEKEYSPLDGAGYGVINVASLALRVVAWSLNKNKHNNIFLLDEPSRFVSADLQEKFMQMLREISDNMGIQFIIITHCPSEDVMEYSNKVFKVDQKDKVSFVKVLKEEN